MSLNNENIQKAMSMNIQELYNYLGALSLEIPELQKIKNQVKTGINIKLDINYYIQPTMKKYLQNKGQKVYLYKKPITTLEKLTRS